MDKERQVQENKSLIDSLDLHLHLYSSDNSIDTRGGRSILRVSVFLPNGTFPITGVYVTLVEEKNGRLHYINNYTSSVGYVEFEIYPSIKTLEDFNKKYYVYVKEI